MVCQICEYSIKLKFYCLETNVLGNIENQQSKVWYYWFYSNRYDTVYPSVVVACFFRDVDSLLTSVTSFVVACFFNETSILVLLVLFILQTDYIDRNREDGLLNTLFLKRKMFHIWVSIFTVSQLGRNFSSPLGGIWTTIWWIHEGISPTIKHNQTIVSDLESWKFAYNLDRFFNQFKLFR